jgi:hypothetical protein
MLQVFNVPLDETFCPNMKQTNAAG